tara:strand:+ start:415 stop:915 length:501 start_codon:yes stop_codon:yes gene_type:complete
MSDTTAPTANNEAAAAEELSNPYEGFFGTRNEVQVPWKSETVKKGAEKGTPYITMDFNSLSDADLIKAVGIKEIRGLVERSVNTEARAHCVDLIGERKNFSVADFDEVEIKSFQDWADGKVAVRVPLADMTKRFWDLMLKSNTTAEEEDEKMDLIIAIKARKQNRK